jgi:hypothetical protein
MANTETMSKLVTFRCPELLADALEAAARKEFTNVSAIACSAAAREMRRLGLLDYAEVH